MLRELLTFIETGVFTRRVQALGLEGSMPRLQAELLANPEAGDVEPGTGGLRKVRIADPLRGKGKRGGARARSRLIRNVNCVTWQRRFEMKREVSDEG